MKKSALLLSCLLMLSVSIAYAEQVNTPLPASAITGSGQLANDKIKPQQWLKDTGAVLISPKDWGPSDWSRFVLYGGLTYLIHENDDHIQSWFQENRSKKTNKLAEVGNAFPVAGAIYLTGTYFSGDDQQRRFAATGLESMTIALLAAEVISVAANRDRPNGENRSFPSSHTAAAFALATVIADEYRDEDKTLPYLAYGLATLTAYGRLNDNKHWGADVVAGALIGHYTAKSVAKLNASRELRLQPYVSTYARGIVVSKQF